MLLLWPSLLYPREDVLVSKTTGAVDAAGIGWQLEWLLAVCECDGSGVLVQRGEAIWCMRQLLQAKGLRSNN